MPSRRPAALEGAPQVVGRPTRADVRRRLIDAALAVFLDVGYAAARLDDIARVAGFSKGAVYSNFGSKQELFAALLADHAATITADVLGRLDSDGSAAGQPGDQAGSAARMLVSQVVAAPAWHLLAAEFALQAGRDEDVRATYREARRAQRAALAAALAERADLLGLPADDDRLELLARLLLAVLNGLAVEHAADPEGVDEQTLVLAVTGVVSTVLGPR